MLVHKVIPRKNAPMWRLWKWWALQDSQCRLPSNRRRNCSFPQKTRAAKITRYTAKVRDGAIPVQLNRHFSHETSCNNKAWSQPTSPSPYAIKSSVVSGCLGDYKISSNLQQAHIRRWRRLMRMNQIMVAVMLGCWFAAVCSSIQTCQKPQFTNFFGDF